MRLRPGSPDGASVVTSLRHNSRRALKMNGVGKATVNPIQYVIVTEAEYSMRNERCDIVILCEVPNCNYRATMAHNLHTSFVADHGTLAKEE